MRRVLTGEITSTIAGVIAFLMEEELDAVTFTFNGVTVTVCPDSNRELIYRDWSRALCGCIDKNVGPYPNPVLTDEEQENDTRIKAENKRKWYAQEKARIQVQYEAVETKLASAPAIELVDKRRKVTMGYAERWARLMQLAMAKGEKLEDVAEATAHEADLEGITSGVYVCAVGILAHRWKHGERLRRWYNLKYQIGNEGEKANESGGVLNIAVISLR